MINTGDLIFLYKNERRNYLITATSSKFHTDKGFIDLSEIIGKKYGLCVKTNLGEPFYVLVPSLYELMMKVHRKTQIIYPKDAGIILTKAAIFPGARVIESGVGSGSFTTVLANFVRPEGKVFSYERNEDFLKNARKNVTRNGLDKWVEFKLREVSDKFDEEMVDFVMIDIGSPWILINAAYHALKPGGTFATICPTYEQLTQTVFTLEESGFTHIESLEVLTRRILVRRGKHGRNKESPPIQAILSLPPKLLTQLSLQK